MRAKGRKRVPGSVSWLAVLLILLLPCAIDLAEVSASSAPTTISTAADEVDNPADYVPPLQINHSGEAAVVLETGRQRLLYNLDAQKRLSIPAACKMMTALIACERGIPLDTPVTISKVAEAAAKTELITDGVVLKSGDKYSLEYLLLRLLFYSSDAAALAIAEQVAGDEAKFVELMNARADALKLNNTVFYNCTGDLLDVLSPPGTNGNYDTELLQYSTVLETAQLVAAALQNQTFSRIIRSSSEHLIFDGNTIVPMNNVLLQIWALSEGRITGAFYSEQSARTFMVAVGRIDKTDIVVVTAGGRISSRLADLQSIVSACDSHYELKVLVEAGHKFTGEQEKTIDGEYFDLSYKKTVTYIAPMDTDFLKDELQYKSFGPFTRPILFSMTAGQVLFELKDGTVIAADVMPSRQLLSRSTLLGGMLEDLQNNQNLATVILAACSLLLLVLLYHVLRSLRRLVHLVSLLIYEKRSRR
jgi:serine-type D-Ala-D-Ala carboxypeptidase (penicillin-binding protein 5/6)